MQIRKMLFSDYHDVYHLWLNTPGMGLNDNDDTQAGIKRYLSRNPDTCFVAEDEGEIVGTILSGHDGRRGLIFHLAVKALDRQRGIGSTLLEHAIEALKDEGISKVYAIVYRSNALGNAFWEKRGFCVPEDTFHRAKEIIATKRINA